MSVMFDRILGLIAQPPEKRLLPDIEYLLPWLRKNSELLARVKKAVLIDLMRHCEYKKIVRDDVIIRQGDIGDCFYVMLTGATSVYIDTFLSGEELAPLPDEVPDKPRSTPQRPPEEEQPPPSSVPKKKRLDRSQFGNYIISYGAGKFFGELALINPDAVRNATIVADDETDLLVINRELFNRSLKAQQEAEYAERRGFINNHLLFRSWNPKYKRLLEMSIRKETYRFGDTITQQGRPLTGLYFILSGEANLSVNPELHRQQYPKFYDGTFDPLTKELGRNYFGKNGEVRKDASQQKYIRVRRRGGYSAAEERQRNKSRTLCVVDSSEILGDVEVVLGMDTHHQTVTCGSPTDVFVLDMKNVDRLLRRKNCNALAMLQDNVEQKLLARVVSTRAAGLDLYRHMLKRLQNMKPKKPTYETTRLGGSEKDKEDTMKTLIELFLKGRAPLITPCVPGSLYYKSKLSEKLIKRSKMPVPPETPSISVKEPEAATETSQPVQRKQSMRRLSARQPRSRLELQKLSFCQPVAYLGDMNGQTREASSITTGPTLAPPETPKTMDSFIRPPSPIVEETEEYTHNIFITQPPLETVDSKPEEGMNATNDFHIADVNVDGMSAISPVRQRPLTTTGQHRSHSTLSSIMETGPLDILPTQLRPKTAPATVTDDTEEAPNADCFDMDTGEGALRKLEMKIRAFHTEYDVHTRKLSATITPMRRFVVEGPDDIPMPGGTAFVRRKPCQRPTESTRRFGGVVRRFILPKDAYKLAEQSLEELKQRAASYTVLRKGPEVAHQKHIRAVEWH